MAEKGIVITIATGRSSSSVVEQFQIIGLKQQTFAIAFNGSCGYEFNSQMAENPRSIFSLSLAAPVARNIIELAREFGFVAQYYNGVTGEVQACPTTDEHRALLRRYAGLVGHSQTIISSYEEAIVKSPAAKILILTADPDSLIKLCKDRFPPDMFHTIKGSPFPFFVEFLPFGVNKGEGLKSIAEICGINMSEVVAFGDGDNDAEMLQQAGLGVAMRNAGQKAKSCANLTMEWTNDQDGVACYLEKMESERLL